MKVQILALLEQGDRLTALHRHSRQHQVIGAELQLPPLERRVLSFLLQSTLLPIAYILCFIYFHYLPDILDILVEKILIFLGNLNFELIFSKGYFLFLPLCFQFHFLLQIISTVILIRQSCCLTQLPCNRILTNITFGIAFLK